MFEKMKVGFGGVSKFFTITPNEDTGQRTFFTNWFNPNNDVSELQQLEQYKGIVYACVSAIAEDVARIKFSMHRSQKDGNLAPIATHPFLDLLKNPNPTQSDYEFIEMTQTHIELTGEAFWYVPKGSVTQKPKELWIMRPDMVHVVPDKDTGIVKGYVYVKDNGRTQIPLDLDEVIHFKMPNPINPYRGMGTVEASLVYIQTEEYSARYSRNFLANNATPLGIVNLKGTIPDPEFQKVKRQWNQEYGSIGNAGKTAFVRNVDLTYQKIGSSLADIDLKELKNLTRDDIMFMFRVSKPILGITEDVNYSNAKTSEYIFAKRVIDPKMNRLVDTLQTFYNSRYKDGHVVTYVSPIPQDNDEKIAYYKAGVNLFLTPNEVREAEGLDPIDGGDVIRMEAKLVPINEARAPSTEKIADTGSTKGKIIKRTTRVVKAAEDDVEESVAIEKTKEDFRKLMVATRDAYVPQFEHDLRVIIGAQRNKVLSQVKAWKKKDFNAGSIDYNTDQVSLDISTAFEPIVLELMKEAGKHAMHLVDPELQYELDDESYERIKKRVARVAADYSLDTQKDLVDAIKRGIDQGYSVTKIRSDIENVFSDAVGYRAERLARTEAANEANSATLDAYKQSGYVVKKEWYAGGGRPCEFCKSLNGTIVKTEDVFVSKGSSVDGVDGGKYLANYSDIEAGNLHPNCMCTILPVIE